MKIFSGRPALALLLLLLSWTLLSECGGKRARGPAPAWLSETAPRSDAEFFYGLGRAQVEIDNVPFRRQTARERARVDLAKVIYAYALSELAGDTAAARQVVEQVLPSRKLLDTYTDEQGNMWARVRVARATVEAAVAAQRK